jgi:hypothetical protein
VSSVIALVMAGCASTGVTTTAPITYAVPTTEQLAAASSVVVVAVAPAGSVSLGTVDAYACQYAMYDPQPTNELAVVLLRIEATKIGATFITSVKTSQSNVDLARNCLTTIHATGLAMR